MAFCGAAATPRTCRQSETRSSPTPAITAIVVTDDPHRVGNYCTYLHRFRTSALVIVVLLAVAAFGTAATLWVTHGSFVLERLPSTDPAIHSDFDTFWRSTRALLAGQDIYRTGAGFPNLNPPLLTVLIAPLGLLEFLPAYRLFVLVTVVLVVATMAAVAIELRAAAAAAVPVTVAVLLSSPVLATLGLGQVYGLLTAGLAAAWILHRHGRLALEGAVIGLVVALKPSLAPVLLIPVLRRQWPTLAVALVTGVTATIAGWAIAGRESLPEWVNLLVGNPVQTYWDNASLPGALLRLTSATDWGRPLVELPGGTVLGLVLGGVLLVLTAWLTRRPPASGPDTALWSMTAASLLVSPLSWHNYLMLLMPGVLVLVTRGRWQVAALLLSLAMIGMEWPTIWYGKDGTASAVPLSLYCAILLTYWAALLTRPAPARRALALHGPHETGERSTIPVGAGPAVELVGPRGEVHPDPLLRDPGPPEHVG
jgi:alpha-1,2-mannosyltransferase